MHHSLENDSFHLFSTFIKLVPPAEVQHIKADLWPTSRVVRILCVCVALLFPMSLFNAPSGQQWWKNTLPVSLKGQQLWPSLKCPGCIWGRGSSRSGLCLFHHVDTTFCVGRGFVRASGWGEGKKNELPRYGLPSSRSQSASVSFSVIAMETRWWEC